MIDSHFLLCKKYFAKQEIASIHSFLQLLIAHHHQHCTHHRQQASYALKLLYPRTNTCTPTILTSFKTS